MTTNAAALDGHCRHTASLYADDVELITAIVEFAAPGLNAGGIFVAVATDDHAAAIESALGRAGVDTAAARADDRLIFHGAAETLAGFSAQGVHDPTGFERTVGRLIDTLAARAREIRVYGEMVALLWEDGHATAAMELEAMWNQLQRQVCFELLCGYPATVVDDGLTAIDDLYDLHTEVCSDGAPVTASRSFDASRDAPFRARCFVHDTLCGWHGEALLDDAVLLVSELATNALIHGRTGFTVRLHRDGSQLRISVRDGDVIHPRSSSRGELATSGRGLGLIAAISRNWGSVPIRGGKTVWAVLDGPAHR